MSSRPVVLVTDGIHESAKAILEASCDVLFEPKLTAEQLLPFLSKIDGLMVRSATQVTASVLAQAPRLKIVGRAGVGTDNIALADATRRGVIVVNSPGGNTTAAAEHTIGMMMALARHIPQADRVVKQGGWRTNALTGVELFGKTLGVIGFGKIGRKVASVFQRMGMQILVYDPFLSEQMADELNVKSVALGTLYAESDFITLHAPKTAETDQLLNEDAFSQMKDSVRIVNCARGALVDEAALAVALESGKVAAVALDVFAQEPLPSDHPLFGFTDRVIMTPHLGASTQEAQLNVALDVAEQIVTYFESGVAQSAVNIPALKKEILEPVQAYMPMAECLGQLLRQLSVGGITQVEVVAQGSLSAENISPLTLATLKGLLSMAREGVNYVNALLIAEEEGITVKESRHHKAGNFSNLLSVHVQTDQDTWMVSGSLISASLFRIVNLNGYPANIEPSAYLLLTPHVDQPGMIGKVATVLGAHQINVSALEVARRPDLQKTQGGESMMVFNLDNPPDKTVLQAIEAIDGIQSAKLLMLDETAR